MCMKLKMSKNIPLMFLQSNKIQVAQAGLLYLMIQTVLMYLMIQTVPLSAALLYLMAPAPLLHPPNIQQFHQQALFPPFNQPQPPFNPAVSIPQDFYSPVTQQQSLAPITQQQSLDPVTQEQSLAPITQELHVLTIPSSIIPPPLPPLITSPPFSHSITHTRASTPPLSDGLLDPDEVIANYRKLQTISNTGRLAMRLASVSYFGKNLLKRSTVYGLKGNASLPGNKVDTPAEFEPVWTKYVNAINHHASSLHKKDKGGVTLELN
uniref:Uncharacterized protein n=1 Tax=Amphimedon queenslandica TaxID=400682 RepID=A0A1X7VM83_AMPQE